MFLCSISTVYQQALHCASFSNYVLEICKSAFSLCRMQAEYTALLTAWLQKATAELILDH